MNDKEFKEEIKDIKKLTDYIRKKYGEDTIVSAGRKLDVISTGSISLDMAIGIGGLPRGRVCDFYGQYSAGKSMLASSVVAQCQKNGGICVYIDAENAFDEKFASILGVDLDPQKLIRVYPETGERAFDIAEQYIKAGVDLVVIDSSAALIPQEFVERSMEDSTLIGLQARLISRGLQKLTPCLAKSNSLCLFIGQVRNGIGGNPYLHQDTEQPTGGLALGFYSSVRVKVSRKEAIKDGDKLLGHKIHCLVKKNKVAPPLKVADFNLIYNSGIDNSSEIFEAAIGLGIITKPEDGIKYFYGDKSWTGMPKLKSEFESNQDFRIEILTKVKEKMYGPVVESLENC